MAFTMVTLTGSYQPRPSPPPRGYVSFQRTATLVNDGLIVPAYEEKVHLTNGAFSIVLPATNDTGTTPTGATYTVTEKIEGADFNSYSIVLDCADTTQDLADIAPTDSTVVKRYATQAIFDVLEARVEALEP